MKLGLRHTVAGLTITGALVGGGAAVASAATNGSSVTAPTSTTAPISSATTSPAGGAPASMSPHCQHMGTGSTSG
jgi:hypothetical protein